MTKVTLAALLIGLAACGGGGNNNVIVPDPDAGPMVCNPRAQTGCEPGQKCANVVLQSNPRITAIECVPDGTVDVGGACMAGPAGAMGYSNCKAGSECISGVCKQICDHQGGDPKCDANHACSRYDDVFESNNMAVAGVCDTKCNPLTQELVIGNNTAACGSMDPAMADNGCFSFDLIDFTCAGIPDEALTLTDRMRAFGPGNGGVYVNGCAAGYLPLLIEETGSMVGICVGICAPAKSDNSSPQNQTNALGDANALAKLHNKAMPAAGDGVCTIGAKGSENQMNCHYLWWYNIEGNQIINSPYNDNTGICFGYSHYKVNHDNDPSTEPVGFPNCAELPPAGATPDPMYGRANEWPCVPTAEIAQLTNGKKKINPVAKSFRLGGSSGPGVRHILRQE